MTDTAGDDSTTSVMVMIECPKPKEDLFINSRTGELVDESEIDGDYATYWYNRLKIALQNQEEHSTIQRKSITFPGSTYVS